MAKRGSRGSVFLNGGPHLMFDVQPLGPVFLDNVSLAHSYGQVRLKNQPGSQIRDGQAELGQRRREFRETGAHQVVDLGKRVADGHLQTVGEKQPGP